MRLKWVDKLVWVRKGGKLTTAIVSGKRSSFSLWSRINVLFISEVKPYQKRKCRQSLWKNNIFSKPHQIKSYINNVFSYRSTDKYEWNLSTMERCWRRQLTIFHSLSQTTVMHHTKAVGKNLEKLLGEDLSYVFSWLFCLMNL